MSAEIIPFPNRPKRPPNEVPSVNVHVITTAGIAMPLECSEYVHNFDSVPGVCRCGQNFWDPPEDPEPV